MSDFYCPTGVTRQMVCPKCNTIIEADEQKGAATNSVYWHKTRHVAVCGLPCFGASVEGRVYTSGRFHNGHDKCPACTPGSVAREVRL